MSERDAISEYLNAFYSLLIFSLHEGLGENVCTHKEQIRGERVSLSKPFSRGKGLSDVAINE